MPNEPEGTRRPAVESVDPESIEGVFVAALGKSSAEERALFLEQACHGDPERRRRVEALLRAYDDAGSFLENPAVTLEPPAEGISLGFLTPTDKPGLLGTLGPYEVLEVIGRGGMGIVLRALDPKLNRVVAVKALAPELAANPNARRRFLREARAVAAISHPHIVTIHAVDEDSLPYLVMECIVGQSLREKLDKSGALRLAEILRIGRQIAEGLAAAHRQGIIHRDIKPANILLENGVERVKITDFGLARAVDDATITKTGEVSGTPQYMSPEQAKGEKVDQRSDLFSLGAVLYAMCTGRSPFRADNIAAVIRRVCDDTPRPVSDVNPEIPEWLDQIVGCLLEKEPDHRFQSAEEVAAALEGELANLQHPQHTTTEQRHLPRPAKRPRVHSLTSPDDGESVPVPVIVRKLSQALTTAAMMNCLMILAGIVIWAAFPTILDRRAAAVLPCFIPSIIFLSGIAIWLTKHMIRFEYGQEARIKGIIGASLNLFLGPSWLLGIPAALTALRVLTRSETVEAYRAGHAGEDMDQFRVAADRPGLVPRGTVLGAAATFLTSVWLASDGGHNLSAVNVLEAWCPALVVTLPLLLFARRLYPGRILPMAGATFATFTLITFLVVLADNARMSGEMMTVLFLGALMLGIPVLILALSTSPSDGSNRPWRERFHAALRQPWKLLAWIVILILVGVPCLLGVLYLAVGASREVGGRGSQLPVDPTTTTFAGSIQEYNGAADVGASPSPEADYTDMEDPFDSYEAGTSMGALFSSSFGRPRSQGRNGLTSAVIVDLMDEGLSVVFHVAGRATAHPNVNDGSMGSMDMEYSAMMPPSNVTVLPEGETKPIRTVSKSGMYRIRPGTYEVRVMDNWIGWNVGETQQPKWYSHQECTIRAGKIERLTVQRSPPVLAKMGGDWSDDSLYSFRWNGQNHSLTRPQAEIVDRLFKAWADGKPDVAEAELLSLLIKAPSETDSEETDSPEEKESQADASLTSLFNDGRHPAWAALIVEGEAPDTYRLHQLKSD